MVAEDVSLLEALRGTVLEAEAEEVTEIGGRAAAELDGDGRGKVGDGLEFWVLLDHAGLVEERDEGLVGGLDQQELERVTVEGDALERVDDRVQDGATSDVTNTSNVLVGEDAVLVEVSERAGLLVEGGGEAVGIGLVVGQLGVDEVVDVPCVLESGGAAEHVVLDTTEEWLSILGLGLELVRAVEVLDVLLEVLRKKEACKSRVRKNGSGTFLEKEKKKRDPIRGKKPPKSPKRHGNPGSPTPSCAHPSTKKKKNNRRKNLQGSWSRARESGRCPVQRFQLERIDNRRGAQRRWSRWPSGSCCWGWGGTNPGGGRRQSRKRRCPQFPPSRGP